MAWVTPSTFKTGDLIDSASSTLGLDAQLKGNLDALSSHTHTGVAGNGEDDITALNTITVDDVSSPSTPSSSTIILYSESGVLKYKNSSGTANTLSLDGHTH